MGEEGRVVAYRRKTVRLECRKCGLRFSVNWLDVARLLLEAGAPGWGDMSAAVGGSQGMTAIEAGARGLGTWDRFVELCEAESRIDGPVVNGEAKT
jgi:hypothetical protein